MYYSGYHSNIEELYMICQYSTQSILQVCNHINITFPPTGPSSTCFDISMQVLAFRNVLTFDTIIGSCPLPLKVFRT